MRIALCRVLLAGVLLPFSGFAQITITGVTDKQPPPPSSVTFTIGTQAGFDYNATLNWLPVEIGLPVVINKPDFYELRVDATNQTTSAVTSRYVRFIVIEPERVGTEWGLPKHVPFPVIQSCSNEFTAAHFRLLVPASFPAGYAVPLVAWVVDNQDHAVRANGVLHNGSSRLFQVKRGVGSGFVSHTNTSGTLNVALTLLALTTNINVAIESNVTWTPVSGTLSGATTWSNNSRIHITGGVLIPAGSSLNVGEGTVVRVNDGLNITNNGTVAINGTVQNPIVFMGTTAAPWGGFIQHADNASFTATGAIFTGSGKEPCWYSNGERGCNTGLSGLGSHRTEQPLVAMSGANCNLTMTDCAAIYLAGQLSHSFSGGSYAVRLTRFLLQRATSGGEYTSANLTVNDSAFIEIPDDSVNFEDEDHDALYIVNGTHFFTNTLFGWTKDDGIDSGGGGAGPLTYQSCWFESTFHEGNSLSGFKNVLTRGTVYFDCGQGIEGGYQAPTSRVEQCFFSMNKSGIRHGDNYPDFPYYRGPMTATNNISIYNHRNLFGFNWDDEGGWTNNYEYFFASNNIVSALDTNYPNNTLWNPATDAWRLGVFGGVGRVGVGFGARGSAPTLFGDGLPVGLSRFCTNEVRVDYSVANAGGTLSSGTLVFPAGLTRSYIPVPTNLPGFVRVTLANPVNAEVTGANRFYLAAPTSGGSSSTNLLLLPRGSDWKYWDLGTDQGTAWRAPGYNDGSWSNGLAQLGFGDSDEIKPIRRTNSVGTVITTFYFRRDFYVTNAAAFTNVSMWMLRDDGGVVYLNGTEAYRSPSMPQLPTVINYLTFATNQSIPTAPADNFIDTATFSASLLISGTNVAAVEIHQHDIGSSDVSFDFELSGNLLPAPAARLSSIRFADDLVLIWSDPAYTLEEADFVTGPWRTAVPAISPSGSQITGTKFFRLKK